MPPVLALFSLARIQGRGLSVAADASVRIREVFSQIQDGQEQVIAYYSEMMNTAERNYCISQRELLAIGGCWNISISTSMGKSSTCAPTIVI